MPAPRRPAQQASSNLIQAQANVASAKANAEATKKQIPVLQAQRKNNEGQLEQVQATLELAQVNLLRTRILAPQAGRATKITAAVGAYAQPGQVLMLFVPENKWVTANFKETQLTLMRPGQPVDISIDAYPGHIFRGHVDSIQAGSGAAFSLLPPENATGNYVKVVQRVPVKIVFDEPPDVDTRAWHVGRADGAGAMSIIAPRGGDDLSRSAAGDAQSLAGRGGDLDRDLHGGARHLDRQRRPSAHCRQHGVEHRREHVGPHELSRRQRDDIADQRLAVRRHRPQALLHVVRRDVHGQLDAVRARAESGDADLLSRAARSRRRRHGAERAGDARRHLPAAEALAGLRALRHRGDRRADHRADARRLDHRQFFLALDLPHQRADRRRSRSSWCRSW